MPASHQTVDPRGNSTAHASDRKWTRRALLRDMALVTLAVASAPLRAQQHGNLGVVTPPVPLDRTWLVVDQTGRQRPLSDLLQHRITALQTIYTGCSSVCPLQGALFSAIQQQMPEIRTNHPLQLLSIGIDPLSDSPSALHDWLVRFQAGPAWNAATPTLHDVDRIRTTLSGSSLPLGNIADHSTQIYCFDASANLRWRSADLPRADEVCTVLGALGRI